MNEFSQSLKTGDGVAAPDISSEAARSHREVLRASESMTTESLELTPRLIALIQANAEYFIDNSRSPAVELEKYLLAPYRERQFDGKLCGDTEALENNQAVPIRIIYADPKFVNSFGRFYVSPQWLIEESSLISRGFLIKDSLFLFSRPEHSHLWEVNVMPISNYMVRVLAAGYLLGKAAVNEPSSAEA